MNGENELQGKIVVILPRFGSAKVTPGALKEHANISSRYF